MSESTTEQPLLSIAIPTWNRAGLLKEALECLESQIRDYKDDIELIISDNASTDETPQVISDFCEKHPDYNIVTWRQKENTGYFGNFKKVRELSTGKYLWILSDDDHVEKNVISLIINEIKNNSNISVVFLDIWDLNPLMKNKPALKGKYTWAYLLNTKGYKVTLISAVIFINNKKNDLEVYKKFSGNTFLGFLFLLNAYDPSKSIIIIKGKCLETGKGEISFNVFDSFIEDLFSCFMFWDEKEIGEDTKKIFINSYLKSVVHSHYINNKLKGAFNNNPDELKKLEERMNVYYKNYSSFWLYIFPFYYLPNSVIRLWKLYYRVHRYVFVRMLNIR